MAQNVVFNVHAGEVHTVDARPEEPKNVSVVREGITETGIKVKQTEIQGPARVVVTDAEPIKQITRPTKRKRKKTK